MQSVQGVHGVTLFLSDQIFPGGADDNTDCRACGVHDRGGTCVATTAASQIAQSANHVPGPKAGAIYGPPATR